MDESRWTPDRLAVLRLARTEGLGPIKLRRLLDTFGSARAVLDAPHRELTATLGIGDQIARAILNGDSEAAVRSMIDAIDRAGIRLIFEDDDEYPPTLREIYDNPVFLTVRGDILPTDRAAVAIVGSRRSTSYGISQASRFAGFLASRGVTIVSGLARGIDRAAHAAALAAGGRTIAVLASGLANIYPPEHVELADEVAHSGALLSEAPIDGAPLAGLFPMRNRVISGLSLGVVVIEAADRSGALSTAHHAVDQNRDVFALPGRVTDPSSQGALRLIQKGAVLVINPEDVLDHLGPIERPSSTADTEQPDLFSDQVPAGLNETEATIWRELGRDDLPVDLLAERTGLESSAISATLLTMELRRLVDRLPGSLFRRRAT